MFVSRSGHRKGTILTNILIKIFFKANSLPIQHVCDNKDFHALRLINDQNINNDKKNLNVKVRNTNKISILRVNIFFMI